MINALLWLTYLVSAVIAFYLVLQLGWRLVGAMLAATVVGTVLALLIMLAAPADDASDWFQVELALNGSLSLIFAGAGAALAFALREARNRKG